MIDEEAVAEFKRSREYQRLGVIGRQKLLWRTFPELARRLAATAQRRVLASGGRAQLAKQVEFLYRAMLPTPRIAVESSLAFR